MICPPVGKSGPKMYLFKVWMELSGLSIRYNVASITSLKLWCAICVAFPRAIPPAPLTSKLGYWAGKTWGSKVVSS